jgi:hypothetical protein
MAEAVDDLDFADLNAVTQGVDHTVILVLEETLLARGEYQEALAALAPCCGPGRGCAICGTRVSPGVRGMGPMGRMEERGREK